VSAVIGGALPWTLALAVGSTALAFVAGSAVGVAAARRPGGLIERVVLPSLVFLGAFPYFWLAMILVWGLSWELDLLPARRAWADGVSPGFTVAFLLSAAEHAILPVATLVLAGAGGWAVGMRNSLISMEQEPWAQFARARGLSERQILRAYMLPLAAVPQVAGLGLAVGYAISGALLTEMVFSYPGMGGLMLEAVRAQDWPLLQGLFLVLALSVTALSAAVDAAVAWLDPRARERG
jgi:peptide/nickel transport system permease protein